MLSSSGVLHNCPGYVAIHTLEISIFLIQGRYGKLNYLLPPILECRYVSKFSYPGYVPCSCRWRRGSWSSLVTPSASSRTGVAVCTQTRVDLTISWRRVCTLPWATPYSLLDSASPCGPSYWEPKVSGTVVWRFYYLQFEILWRKPHEVTFQKVFKVNVNVDDVEPSAILHFFRQIGFFFAWLWYYVTLGLVLQRDQS